jgi:hypothetical protein
MMTGGTIVVFYHARWHLPLRAANEAHLSCWGLYARHRVVYVNIAFGVPQRLLDKLDIVAIIFDTIFLSMHWSPDYFRARTRDCLAFRELDCTKIAVVQDEFYNLDLVVDFLRRVGITHVFTCSDAAEWNKFYGKLDLGNVALRTALTGYVDERRLGRLPTKPIAERSIDIGYRAWANPYWLGEHGLEKVRVGQIIARAARERGLCIDINNPAALDFLIGDGWFGFLAECRAVIGVEGGASILDRDGSVKTRVEAYVAEHAGASFEEARDACFPGRDHEINLACLSPRHFEACMMRTAQVLLEGRYNGVFEPWKHYIPIKKDYSNLEQVFAALGDSEGLQRMVDRAYDDIIASGKWSYRRFVRDVEISIIDARPSAQAKGGTVATFPIYAALRLHQAAEWSYCHFECTAGFKKVRGTATSLRNAISHTALLGRKCLRIVTRPRSVASRLIDTLRWWGSR